ncbi:MAG: A/G-specific adenine glycosylase [Clostridia bacterium]|nr:A/G-specific adenine glycosylase [Clostridia bacterium]
MGNANETPILSPEAVDALLGWYRSNARDLPWRHTRDPYRVWISEIMLQQTRVEAVKPYYARFLEAFPTVFDLAAAPEDRLLKLWEGLGYYSRARNLQKAAQMVVRDYGGEMPADETLLRSLPGIGDYTAGAIASIAFGLPVPAVDGNVLRVLSRAVGSRDDIADPAAKSRFRSSLRSVIPTDASAFTQSLIELGACVCVPNGDPKCAVCPLAPFCVANRDDLTAELPVKSSKKPRRIENLTVFIIRDGARTALRKRPPAGLLAGLYEYPNVRGHLSPHEVPAVIRTMGFAPLDVRRVEDAKHVFTHIEWHMIAYTVHVAPMSDGYHPPSGCYLVNAAERLSDYAIPSAFSAYTKYGTKEPNR